MTEFLSRTAILEAPVKTAEVEVKEWGGVVLVREMSAAEVDDLAFDMMTPGGSIDRSQTRGKMVRIAATCIIDAQGNRLFSDEDIEALKEKSFDPIRRVAEKVMQLSGLAGQTDESGDNNSKNPL